MPFKIYIDSRFRRDVGGVQSDSEFSIELPHPIKVKGKAFCDICVIANSFYTIRENENDRIHIKEGSTFRICQIQEGQYNLETLKDAVLSAFNTGRPGGLGQYTVTSLQNKSKLQISNVDPNADLIIYSAAYLKNNQTVWTGSAISYTDLMSCDHVVGFANISNILQFNINNVLELPNAINVQPYNQLFLRSDLGLGYDAVGADGSGDIVRRIVCAVPLNNFVVDTHSIPTDTISIGHRQIQSLSFRLTDVYGQLVNTRGHPISFSLIFIDED